MNFVKMEGLGNDFVVVERLPTADEVRRWCDRRRGIGADGVLAVSSEVSMRYWNADGSPAEMCGNGLRCVARYAVDRGWAEEGTEIEIATAVGRRRAWVAGESVRVEVGPVSVGEMVTVAGIDLRQVSVGNPHAVAVVDSLDGVDVAVLGRRIGTDRAFPGGTNVEWVVIDAPDRIRLRVWERGVGETPACGSGMVAAAAVSKTKEGPIGPTRVEVTGGVGEVTFEGQAGYLTGPARRVYSGSY